MWYLNSTDILTKLIWKIIGNGFRSVLILQYDDINGWSGSIYGDPLSDISVAENFLKFRRNGNGNGFYQEWSGSILMDTAAPMLCMSF